MTTTRNFCTPQQLTSISGRYGYYIEEDCCTLNNLSDVNLDNLQNGDILCYNETTQLWENCPQAGAVTKACPQDESQEIAYYRLGARIIVPPAPALDITVKIGSRPFRIPRANFTAGTGTDGMNNYDVRGIAISAYTNLKDAALDNLWIQVGAINPPISTPDQNTIDKNNTSPQITLPTGECNKVTFHCITSPKLKAGALDDGNLGMVFRLSSTDVAGYHFYFQQDIGVGIAADTAISYMWITECDSHSYSSNSVIVDNQTPATKFKLEAILYQGIIFQSSGTNTTLQGINVQGLFEIEPFFYLTKERIILS